MYRVSRTLLSGAIGVGGSANRSASLMRALVSVTGSFPRLYTVIVTGIESPNARSSCGAVVSTETPAVRSAAAVARFVATSSEASRSSAAASHAASGSRSPTPLCATEIAPKCVSTRQRGVTLRAACSSAAARASQRTAPSGCRRFTASRAESSSACAVSSPARTSGAAALASRAKLVSTPSKMEVSSPGGVDSFTREPWRTT